MLNSSWKEKKILATRGLSPLWQCLTAAGELLPGGSYAIPLALSTSFPMSPPGLFALPARPMSVYELASYPGSWRGQHPLIPPWLISFTQKPACFFPLNFRYLLLASIIKSILVPLSWCLPGCFCHFFIVQLHSQPLHQDHADENSTLVSTLTFRLSRPFVYSSNSTPTVKSKL